VELHGAGVELLLDRAGFEQVVTNLVINAAHAAGAGGTVRLSSRMKAEYFEVIVEDNGAGIPADVVQRMFEPFFTTKPTGQGVGLGLSVSMGIVQAHGGVLLAENRPEEVGGGARFIMRIPGVAGAAVTDDASELPMSRITPTGGVPSSRRASPSDGQAISEPPSGPKALPQRKSTILIIDDEHAIRQGLRRFLTRRGWAVEESADGADALAKLLRPEAARIYDVVLCDLKMAGVSGMDVYERTMSAAPLIARRFILSTGDTTAPDVAGFLSQVSVPVLEKPFELAALEALAEEVKSAGSADVAAAGQGPA
jgi:CheY-like chemotaxis protein